MTSDRTIDAALTAYFAARSQFKLKPCFRLARFRYNTVVEWRSTFDGEQEPPEPWKGVPH